MHICNDVSTSTVRKRRTLLVSYQSLTKTSLELEMWQFRGRAVLAEEKRVVRQVLNKLLTRKHDCKMEYSRYVHGRPLLSGSRVLFLR